MSSGLTFKLNHTWSKTLSDAGAGRSACFWQIEKTRGESDRRHVCNATAVYEPPFGAGRAMNPGNVVARAVASGWRLSSITRQFRITERFKLDFSTEAFNVANAVIFSGPASLDINNVNFGRITGQQNSARSVQFALKVSF